jgi:hypothetical protein
MGDPEAGKWFVGDPCGICQDKAWNVQKKGW